ncbi:MAG: carbohydrate ABC transporter permease [Candidatus Parvarchaeota archaeon]
MKVNSFSILLCIGVMLVILFYFGPIFWAVLMSLRPEEEVYSLSLPSRLIFERYYIVATSDKYIPTFFNSLKATAIATPLVVLIASPASYVIARMREIKGRVAFFMFYLLMMFLPPVALAGYLYELLINMKLYDTIPGLILVYSGLFTPFAIWILSSYFRGIPKEIEEAAMVDGASRLQMLFKIILPISLPGVAVTSILVFISVWSEFLIANTITLTYNSRPVTLGVLMFAGVLEMRWSEIATAAIIGMMPVMIIAFLTSRYIVRGLSAAIIRG